MKGKEFQAEVKGTMIFNDSLVMINSVVKGCGLILTTEDAIQNQINDGLLEIVLSKFVSKSTGSYLYYPQRAQMQPKLRGFIDHIRGQIES